MHNRNNNGITEYLGQKLANLRMRVQDLETRPLHSHGTGFNDLVAGLVTGWIPDDVTWTYASATTFTVPGDVTALFPVGTKIKLTQTTVKYFYVRSTTYSAPNTTITITGGSDYTLANAAIANPQYSYASSPQGFPHWFNYAATLSGDGGSAGSYAESDAFARFSITGRTVHLKVYKFVTNKGSWTGNIYMALPSVPVNLGSSNTMQAGLTWYANAVAPNPLTLIRWQAGASVVTFLDVVNSSFFAWTELAVNTWLSILVSYEI